MRRRSAAAKVCRRRCCHGVVLWSSVLLLALLLGSSRSRSSRWSRLASLLVVGPAGLMLLVVSGLGLLLLMLRVLVLGRLVVAVVVGLLRWSIDLVSRSERAHEVHWTVGGVVEKAVVLAS